MIDVLIPHHVPHHLPPAPVTTRTGLGTARGAPVAGVRAPTMSPTYPITPDEVWWTRQQLAQGAHLALIAEDLGCEPDDLDLALWNHLGQSLEAA